MVSYSCLGTRKIRHDLFANAGPAPDYRYFPYWITVSSLTIAFIALLLWLISQRRLLPSIVILGAFMFFVLWLVGLIVVSIEMWSASGSVSSNCDRLVFNTSPSGNNLQTLAWLQQKSICES